MESWGLPDGPVATGLHALKVGARFNPWSEARSHVTTKTQYSQINKDKYFFKMESHSSG